MFNLKLKLFIQYTNTHRYEVFTFSKYTPDNSYNSDSDKNKNITIHKWTDQYVY